MHLEEVSIGEPGVASGVLLGDGSHVGEARHSEAHGSAAHQCCAHHQQPRVRLLRRKKGNHKIARFAPGSCQMLIFPGEEQCEIDGVKTGT